MAKPSTKSGKDPAATYSGKPSRLGSGTLAGALASSLAKADSDPLVKYCPHDGKA